MLSLLLRPFPPPPTFDQYQTSVREGPDALTRIWLNFVTHLTNLESESDGLEGQRGRNRLEGEGSGHQSPCWVQASGVAVAIFVLGLPVPLRLRLWYGWEVWLESGVTVHSSSELVSVPLTNLIPLSPLFMSSLP